MREINAECFFNKIPNQDRTKKIAIVDWLISNTTLTTEQIKDLVKIDGYIVDRMFNDSYKNPFLPLNPIDIGLISEEFIHLLEKNSKLQAISLENFNYKLNRYDIAELSEMEVISVGITKVYFLCEGHNAWWGTWSSHFLTDGSLHTSLESAKKHAEKQRIQGRVFTIHEIPAIFMDTNEKVIYIAAINQSKEPFSVCRRVSYVNFYQLKTRLIMENNTNRYPKFIFASLDCKNLIPSILPVDGDFYTYKSVAVGTEYLLNYTSRKEEVHMDDIRNFKMTLEYFVSQKCEEVKKIDISFSKVLLYKIDEVFELSVRASCNLNNNGIIYIGDLIQRTEKEIRKLVPREEEINLIKTWLNTHKLGFEIQVDNWSMGEVKNFQNQ